jgi:hypothetical protein
MFCPDRRNDMRRYLRAADAKASATTKKDFGPTPNLKFL